MQAILDDKELADDIPKSRNPSRELSATHEAIHSSIAKDTGRDTTLASIGFSTSPYSAATQGHWGVRGEARRKAAGDPEEEKGK